MSEWQPISTAPRVTRVLVGTLGETIVDIAIQYHKGEGKWIWITDDKESVESGYFNEGEPTHWMPLPEPPREEESRP
jgi:hypothetical protein